MVRESVDGRDGARGIGKDGVPVLKRQVRCQHNRLLLVATADDLKQEVGRVRVVREIANLVNAEERGPRVGAEASLEGPGGFLGGEIEDEIEAVMKACRMAREAA